METVLERVRDYLDDAGFVYVFEQQQKEFSNMLAKSRLTFVTLHESELRVYPGKRNVLAAQEGDTVSLEELKDQRIYSELSGMNTFPLKTAQRKMF